MQTGKVSLDAASTVATLPTNEQREVVEQGNVRRRAKEIRDKKKKAKTPAPTQATPALNEKAPDFALAKTKPESSLDSRDLISVDDALSKVLVEVSLKGSDYAEAVIQRVAQAAKLDVFVLGPLEEEAK